jgi:hypothetical protein
MYIYFREERRVSAMVQMGERARRMREAIEVNLFCFPYCFIAILKNKKKIKSGKRQEEEERRGREV